MWTLHLNPKVTSLLYALRDDGANLRRRLVELQNADQPWDGAIVLPGVPGRYEVDHAGYWIGFRVDRREKTITILYIEVN